MTKPYDDQSGPQAPAQYTADPAPPSGASAFAGSSGAHSSSGAAPGGSAEYGAPAAGSSSAGSSSAGQSSAGQSPVGPVSTEAPAQADPGPHRPAAGFDEKGRVKRSRISAVWVTLIVAAIGLILLVIFIAQNSKVVPIHFLGFDGHLAVGLTVLIAAVVGLLLAAIAGSIRIVQLRKALKTNVPKDQRAP